MLSKQEPKSDLQISFYLNLEDYLGIRERNDKFVFQSLENVDSHSDRIAMGKAICAFLFLRNCSFDFVKDKDSYAWLLDFLPEKEVNRICGTIEQQYRALGKDGITDLYKQLPAAPSLEQIEQEEDIAESQVDIQEVEEEPESIDDFSLLKSIVEDHIEKRDEFGKRVSNYPEIIKKELGKSFPRLSYDAVIGMTKIGNGYLTFTTYAMYVKDGSFIKGEYRCLPYKNIKYTDMAMAEGKSAGTRKIIIPYTDEAGKQTSITIDDGVLTEESLRDLLKNIHESNCNTAGTDRFVKLGELNKEQIKDFLSLLSYVLKKNGSSISEVFVLAVFLKLHDPLGLAPGQILFLPGLPVRKQYLSAECWQLCESKSTLLAATNHPSEFRPDRSLAQKQCLLFALGSAPLPATTAAALCSPVTGEGIFLFLFSVSGKQEIHCHTG